MLAARRQVRANKKNPSLASSSSVEPLLIPPGLATVPTSTSAPFHLGTPPVEIPVVGSSPTGVESLRVQKKRKNPFTVRDSTRALPEAAPCLECGAKRFHIESKHFCCTGGAVCLVSVHALPSIRELLAGRDEFSVNFRRHICTYNNNFAFTTFGARYDPALTSNVDRELKAWSESYDGFNLEILQLLMSELSQNPYCQVFKALRHIPNLASADFVLNADPKLDQLDQRVYNLPSAEQVSAVYVENFDPNRDHTIPIQVYNAENKGYPIKHFYGCYDPMQYPILFPQGQNGWNSDMP